MSRFPASAAFSPTANAAPGPWLAGQLVALLGTSRAPAALVRAGVLVRISHVFLRTYGVYYVGAVWDSLSDDERHLAIAAGHHSYVMRWGPPSRSYSHLTAARAHGLDLWEPDKLIHATAPAAITRGRRRGDVFIHGGGVPAEQRTVIAGLPVTTLEHLVGAEMGGPGIVPARRAVLLGSALSESAAESLLSHLMAGMPLPRPEQQIRVATRFGQHRIDTGWPAIRRGIEVDGKKKYFDYAPTDEVIFRERQREKGLMEDGWGLLRVEWKDLFRPVELEQRILRLILSAGDPGIQLLRSAGFRAAG